MEKTADEITAEAREYLMTRYGRCPILYHEALHIEGVSERTVKNLVRVGLVLPNGPTEIDKMDLPTITKNSLRYAGYGTIKQLIDGVKKGEVKPNFKRGYGKLGHERVLKLLYSEVADYSI